MSGVDDEDIFHQMKSTPRMYALSQSFAEAAVYFEGIERKWSHLPEVSTRQGFAKYI
jgi:hypothetical protein